MACKIYVGNLSYNLDDRGLEALFTAYGRVSSARVIMDHGSGRSKGFGFVEMENDADGQAAIAGLNGKDVEGKLLTVNKAQPREIGARGGHSRGGAFGGRDRSRPGRSY